MIRGDTHSKSQGRLSKETQGRIGEQLRANCADTLNQAIPDHLMKLVERLREAETKERD